MPQTINGIGTIYYGKENWLKRQGQCEECGHWGVLDSYDTREFFAVVFIPVIPMQKKRVIDDCRRCRKHRVMKLAEWTIGREEGLLEAKAAFNSNRCSDTGQALVGACIAWHSLETLQDNRAALESTFGSSAEDLDFLGGAFQFFGHHEEAQTCFRKALQREPDNEEIKESLAYLDLLNGRPDEAHRHMDHALRNPEEKAWLILLLADAYLAKGNAMTSLQVLHELEQRFPEIGKEREFKQLMKWSKKVSEGGKGPFKPIMPMLAAGKTTTPSKPAKSTLGSKLPLLIAPALFILLAGGFSFYSLHLKENRTLVLANGWNKKYSVKVNGEIHVLLPDSMQSVPVPEGEVEIEPGPEAPVSEPITATISGTFFGRVLDGKTYAVNPDRLAVFVLDQVEYAVNPDPDKTLPYTLYVGQAFMTLPEADYHFEDFPEEVELPSGRDSTVKSRLTMLQDWSAEELLGEVFQKNETSGIQFATRQVQYGNNEEWIWNWLATYLMPEDLRPLIAPRLEAEPLDLEAHRVFQNSGIGTEAQPDLEQEYRAFLQARPEDADRRYLLARVVMDEKEANLLLLQAVRAPQPQPYAFHALGYDHLYRGELKQAAALFVQGAELDPDNTVQQNNLRTSWKITQDYGRLAEAYRSDLEKDPLDVEAMSNLIKMEALMGAEPPRLKDLVTDMIRPIPRDGSWGKVAEWKEFLLSSPDYLLLQPETLAANPLAEEYHFTKSQLAMITGDHQQAVRLMHKEKVDDPFSWLILYSLQMHQGDEEGAAPSLDKALSLLSDSWVEAFTLLGAEEPPSLEDWKTLDLSHNLKAILCLAAGYRFPDQKSGLHLLAQRLNFEPEYPQREVARLIVLN